MITIPMVIQVSKRVWDLYQQGKVDFSSGGFRWSNGRLEELYKSVSPAINAGAARVTPFMPFDPASAYGIQLSNKIGLMNYAMSAANGRKLSVAINMIAGMHKLAWATTALSAANLALSAVGFTVVIAKLNGLSRQLTSAVEELKKEMKSLQIVDKTLEIKTLIANLKSVTDVLSVHQLREHDLLQIEGCLNKAKEMILWLKEQFETIEPIKATAIFALMFDLITIYSSVLKEYGAQYYFLYDRYPGNYDGWLEVFTVADSKALKSGLKRTILLASPLEATDKIENAFDFTLNTIHLQLQDLTAYRALVPTMPLEACIDFDAYMKKRLEEGSIEIVETADEEDERERILLRKNGFSAA